LTVLRFERFPVDQDRTKDFERLAAQMLAVLRSAPGALWAEAARTTEGDPGYLVVSEWRTPADADAWASSDEAGRFDQGAEALLRGDVSRRRFTATD
jgi:heme-degrading monooxygenase HmoA